MSNSAHGSPDVHPTVLLLPWYLSGQLGDAQREDVERHLQVCATCKDELDSLGALRAQAREAFDRMPGPSAGVRAEVLRRVDERLLPRINVLDRLARACRLLLQPKWAPAMAVLIIAGQFGALAWLVVRTGVEPQVQSRAVPVAATRLRIVFNPAAPEGEAAAALRALGARIVDGPGADGAYTIELAAASPRALAARLGALRERRDLVERIDTAPP
jgi:anti-sigma factor RsiW